MEGYAAARPKSANCQTQTSLCRNGAAARMVADRLLLPQDANRAVELAAQDRLSQLH